MSFFKRLQPSPAMVVALLSLIVSVSGVAYAATKIGTKDIRNRAVTSKKLATGTVKKKNIKNKAVTRAKIGDGAINTGKVADQSLQGEDLLDGAVGTRQLADLGVTTDKIGLSQVDNPRLATDSVTSSTILDGQVRGGDLGPITVRIHSLVVPTGVSGSVGQGCLSGERVLSGGGFFSGGAQMNLLVQQGPVDAGNGWFADGRNDTGARQTLNARVLCLAE